MADSFDPRSPYLLEREYAAPYEAYRADPNPARADAVLRALHPAIESGIRSFGGTNVNPMLRSHARRLTLDSLGSYDPARGPLKVHVANTLRGLNRYALRQQQVLSVPERVALEHRRVADSEREFQDEFGREPSTQELADRVKLSPRRIATVRRYRPGLSSSQAQYANEEGDVEDPAVAPAPDDGRRRAEFLYDDVDATDQAILEGHFGLFGRPKRPLTATARALNLTTGALSQRAARLQAMLDELSDAQLF